MDIDKYCDENYIPKPYQYCKSILDRIIKHNIYPNDIFNNWDRVNRDLINIFGILCDIKLITSKELNDLKILCIDHFNTIDDIKAISFFMLYFNKIEYYRIPKVANIDIHNKFFNEKGIQLNNLDWYDNPFVSKFYLPIIKEGTWLNIMDISYKTLDELTQLLYKLNDKMIEYNLDHEVVYIIGGFVCLVNNDKSMSQDIDYYCKNNSIGQIAYEIGEKYDAFGWFSNLDSLSRHGYLPSLDELLSINNSFIEYMALSKLTIYIQTDKCLLLTKLISCRDKDINDIKNVIKRLNIQNNEQLLSYINEYLSLDSINKQCIIENINKIF